MNITNITIANIIVDEDVQSRVNYDRDTVADYEETLIDWQASVADAIKKASSVPSFPFPPITVVKNAADESYWLADGFHRVMAARSLIDLFTIPANVVENLDGLTPKRKAILISLGANQSHGLRRSNADKRRAVEMVLEDPEWSEFSTRKIAEMCGVSHTTVQNILAEIKDEAEENTDTVATPPTSADTNRFFANAEEPGEYEWGEHEEEPKGKTNTTTDSRQPTAPTPKKEISFKRRLEEVIKRYQPVVNQKGKPSATVFREFYSEVQSLLTLL